MNLVSVTFAVLLVLALGVAGVVLLRRVRAYVAGAGWASQVARRRRPRT